MALLAIRTTLKPDIGATPADLVYGEGLAVPGDLLPSTPANDDDSDRQRRNMLANLRLEVERLQPMPTSAHRRPLIHLPESLDTASHVFIRRGGVTPPLTTPYEGPFQVDSRTETGFNVHIPGRGIEEIALARVKPAFIDMSDPADNQENLDANIPPSPPGPGQPEPSDHATCQRQPDVPGPSNAQPQPPAFDPDVFGFDDNDTDQQPQRPRHVPQPAPRKRPRRGTPHIADFNVPQSPTQQQERARSPFSDEGGSSPSHDPDLNQRLQERWPVPADAPTDNPVGGPPDAALPDVPMEEAAPRWRPGAGGHGGSWRRRPDINFLQRFISEHLGTTSS